MRFLLGLAAGLIALGGYYGYQRWQAESAPPCGGHCGEGTECREGLCQIARASKGAGKRRRRRGRRRRRRKPAAQPPGATAPELKRASAADLRPRAAGPALGGVDRIDLTHGGADRPELSRAAVDSRFRRLEPRLLACVARAREGWQVAGKVSVGFRIERSGAVEKVRLTAPALLMRGGLYRCVAPLVRSLRFPSSGRSLIMTYPYAID